MLTGGLVGGWIGFCNGTCLVLYVYLRNPDDDGELDSSVLTYYITSFSMD